VSIQYQGDFAAALDRAIQRSNGHAKVGEPKVIEHSADELREPLLPNAARPMRRT
jgi:hypothetical protein